MNINCLFFFLLLSLLFSFFVFYHFMFFVFVVISIAFCYSIVTVFLKANLNLSDCCDPSFCGGTTSGMLHSGKGGGVSVNRGQSINTNCPVIYYWSFLCSPYLSLCNFSGLPGGSFFSRLCVILLSLLSSLS